LFFETFDQASEFLRKLEAIDFRRFIHGRPERLANPLGLRTPRPCEKQAQIAAFVTDRNNSRAVEPFLGVQHAALGVQVRLSDFVVVREDRRHDQEAPVGQDDDGLFEQLKRQSPQDLRLEQHEFTGINSKSDDIFDGTGAEALVLVFAYSASFDGPHNRPLGK
jgi:hypothetical protein